MNFPHDLKEKHLIFMKTSLTKLGLRYCSNIEYGCNRVINRTSLFFIKVDYVLLFGLITGVLDIIPLVGPTIALILCLS